MVRQLGGLVSSAAVATGAALVGTSAAPARAHTAAVACTYACRRYTVNSGTSSGCTTDTKEETKSEFAKMDMSTSNFTVGRFKGAEEAAISQEEKVQPLPEGAAAAAGHSCGCSDARHGEHHGDRAAAGAPPSSSSSSSSTFGRIFSQEAAAMMATRTPGAPVDPLPDHPHIASSSGSVRPSSPASAHTSWTAEEQHQLQKQREAAEEMQRFLAQNTLRSIQRSAEREREQHDTGDGHVHRADSRLPPGRRGVRALLDYNKQWAAEVSRFNPRYFVELAKEQKPEYLWIGCSDSRVPANEVIGLHPGDVFVHRNIGNIFSLSDLNCLSALQFAVDCLKVQHVIIAGHYKCGGVTAAMNGTSLGLTDHWIMQVTDIKNKFWDRVTLEIPEAEHLNVLCELNVLQQLSHAANCRIVQRLWKAQNDDDHFYRERAQHIHVRPRYAQEHGLHHRHGDVAYAASGGPHEVDCHGWVYSLDDGMLRPLLSLTRRSDVKKQIEDATEAVFIRYSSR